MRFAKTKRAPVVRASLLAMLAVGCVSPSYGELALEIVGGHDTDISKVPWQVALMNDSGQFCGGSILNKDWVLSAGHCVSELDAGKISVLAGVSRLTDAALGQKVEIVQVFRVPGFIDPTQGKDVALLRLGRSLDLSGPSARAISLVTEQDATYGLTKAGVTGLVSGWGVMNPDALDGPDQLQSVEVPILDEADAQAAYADVPITVDQLAASFHHVGGKDACFGDSGGPFVVPNKTGDGYLLAGTVSWGQSCAEAEFPGMYGRVSFFGKFISDTIAGAGELPGKGPVLVINEILADPAHDANGDGKVSTTEDEFIELVNSGDKPLDLSGATVSDAVKVQFTFPAGVVLPPGAVIVIFGGGKPAAIGQAGIVTAPLHLNNDKDAVTVRAADGKVLADASYAGFADGDQSIVRQDEGSATSAFVLHTTVSETGLLASPGTRANGQAFQE